jgi:gluconokinase
VLACSALKRTYRDELQITPEIQFVYLKAPAQLLRQRLHARQGHYMTEQMLESQLEALEEPEQAVTIDVDRSPADIVSEIRNRLALEPAPS